MSPARDDARAPGSPAKRVMFAFARANIRDGDLLLWRGDYVVSKVFEWLTDSYYSHAAIAAHWGDELMLLQAEAVGIQAVPLHVTVAKYPGRVDWYPLRSEIRRTIDLAPVLHEAKRCLGWEFGYLEVLRAIGYRVLGIHNPYDAKHPHAMFCSEYVSTCFRKAGVVFKENTDDADTFPQDIANARTIVEFAGTIHADATMPEVAGVVPALPLGGPIASTKRGEHVAESPESVVHDPAGPAREGEDLPAE